MPVPEREDDVLSEPEPVFLAESEPTPSGPTVTPSAVTDTAQEPVEDSLPSFDPKHRLDFEGLLYLGHLTDEFIWMGHRFTIRTITTNEYLEIALLHRRFAGTIGDVRAYTTAVVAACLVLADGQDIPLPLERTTRDVSLEYRFRYISEHWYPWIIDAIYERFQQLEGRVEQVMEAMGKASG